MVPTRHVDRQGVIPPVEVRPLAEFATYRHARDGWSISLGRDLAKTADALRRLAPEDADEEDLKSPRSRAVFRRLMPPETPAFFLLMVLGYLERGWLSRPIGGTAQFRDALIHHYRALGGEALVNTTVEEILVSERRSPSIVSHSDLARSARALSALCPF